MSHPDILNVSVVSDDSRASTTTSGSYQRTRELSKLLATSRHRETRLSDEVDSLKSSIQSNNTRIRQLEDELSSHKSVPRSEYHSESARSLELQEKVGELRQKLARQREDFTKEMKTKEMEIDGLVEAIRRLEEKSVRRYARLGQYFTGTIWIAAAPASSSSAIPRPRTASPSRISTRLAPPVTVTADSLLANSRSTPQLVPSHKVQPGIRDKIDSIEKSICRNGSRRIVTIPANSVLLPSQFIPDMTRSLGRYQYPLFSIQRT